MSAAPLDLDGLFDRMRDDRTIPAGAIFDAWRVRVLSPIQFGALSPSLQLAYLAWLDLLAPTSHNSVPQRFRLQPAAGALEVWLDRRFVLSASDVVGRQAAVSLGCGITNAVLGARAFGWGTAVELLPVPVEATRPEVPGEPRYTRVASLRFEPGAHPPEGERWLRAMLARKVFRVEFDERVKLEPSIVEELHEVVAAYDGLELHLLSDSATLLFLGKFQELADTTVFNREAFATELGDWLLPNDAPSPLGMRGQEYGLSDDTARRIHLGLLRRAPLLPDEMAGFAKAGNLGMRSSAAVAVITVEEDTVPHRIRVGQAYEEMALRLLGHRLCTAVHAGITEVDAPNLALRGRLRTRRRPTMVCRIGRPLREADWSRPHAARPELGTLFLPDDQA